MRTLFMYTRNPDIDTDRLIIDVVLSSKWMYAWNDFDLMQPPFLAAQNLTEIRSIKNHPWFALYN